VFSASAAPGNADADAASATALHGRGGAGERPRTPTCDRGVERTGLTVLTDAVVDQLVIARGRVTGVRLRTADGPRDVGVDEVVSSAGAIGARPS
jgi:choline dehydrogenase-like flavoprotein